MTDQIHMILISSMKYTFICDFYAGKSAFSYYLLIKNLHTTLNSFRDIRNSSENEREMLRKTT